MLLKWELYPPYTPFALANGEIPVTNGLWSGCARGLTVPDFDEGVFHRGAGGGIRGSKVHEEFCSSIAVAIRTERPCAYVGAYSCNSVVITNELVDIAGTFSDFGGGETGHLWAGGSDR